MLQGKVNAALHVISKDTNRGLLSLDSLIPTGKDSNGEVACQTTIDILREKHPKGWLAVTETLLPESRSHPVEQYHNSIVFEQITGEAIRKAALHTHGAAGPSGVDAYAWGRPCSSFKTASTDICNASAAVARRLCTTDVHPGGLTAFAVACRLIPLNKNPGVRPTGIGEVSRRIMAKAILKTIGDDIQSAAGPFQACAGHEAGCEAAVHTMKEIYSREDTEAILLVDATNALNAINRQAALHNIRVICPAVSTVLNNTYRAPVRLYNMGEGEIESTEGTTQGDPLAMAMYALAATPLICRLKDMKSDVKQVWFADDATAVGKLRALLQWWQHLRDIGPAFGYYPNASKTHLVVKPELMGEAARIFENTEVQITPKGQRHLGAAIDTSSFAEEYVALKVEKWTAEISALSTLAHSQPHAVYAAFVHGITGRWKYVMRTINSTSLLFQPLENAIHQLFIPALTGREPCSPEEIRLSSLPARLGGLNIVNPMAIAENELAASKQISAPLMEMIINQTDSFTKPQLNTIKSTLNQQKRQFNQNAAQEVKEELSRPVLRAIELANEKGSSTWLTALPLQDQGFNLNKREFHDALSLRYRWQLKNTPRHCICGAAFSTDHTMICPHGGLPIMRHNDIRDITANWLSEVCHDVEREPPLLPLTGETIIPLSANRRDDARADIRGRGFWGRQQSAFFDVPKARASQKERVW